MDPESSGMSEEDEKEQMAKILEAYYKKWNPDKIGNIPAVINVYFKRKEDLANKLKALYGEAPDFVSVVNKSPPRSPKLRSPPTLPPGGGINVPPPHLSMSGRRSSSQRMENEPPTPTSVNNSVRRTSSTDRKQKHLSTSSMSKSGRRLTTGAPGTPMFSVRTSTTPAATPLTPQNSGQDSTTVHRSITNEGYGNNSRRSVTSGQTPVRRISTTLADGSKRKVTSMENNNNNNSNLPGSRRTSSTGNNNNNNMSGSRRQSSAAGGAGGGRRTSTRTSTTGIRRVSSVSNASGGAGGARGGGWNKRVSTAGRSRTSATDVQVPEEVFEMPPRKYDGFTTQPPLAPGEKQKRYMKRLTSRNQLEKPNDPKTEAVKQWRERLFDVLDPAQLEHFITQEIFQLCLNELLEQSQYLKQVMLPSEITLCNYSMTLLQPHLHQWELKHDIEDTRARIDDLNQQLEKLKKKDKNNSKKENQKVEAKRNEAAQLRLQRIELDKNIQTLGKQLMDLKKRSQQLADENSSLLKQIQDRDSEPSREAARHLAVLARQHISGDPLRSNQNECHNCREIFGFMNQRKICPLCSFSYCDDCMQQTYDTKNKTKAHCCDNCYVLANLAKMEKFLA